MGASTAFESHTFWGTSLFLWGVTHFLRKTLWRKSLVWGTSLLFGEHHSFWCTLLILSKHNTFQGNIIHFGLGQPFGGILHIWKSIMHFGGESPIWGVAVFTLRANHSILELCREASLP